MHCMVLERLSSVQMFKNLYHLWLAKYLIKYELVLVFNFHISLCFSLIMKKLLTLWLGWRHSHLEWYVVRNMKKKWNLKIGLAKFYLFETLNVVSYRMIRVVQSRDTAACAFLNPDSRIINLLILVERPASCTNVKQDSDVMFVSEF